MSVIILKESGDRLNESFNKILNKLDFSPKGKIFIKPNFSGRPPIIAGENTDPIFLGALAKFLIKKGADEIIIGHGSLLSTADKHFPFEKMIEDGGFSFLKQIPKIRVVNLDEELKEIITYKNIKFSIPKFLKTIDTYINLAKAKTHMETTVSLSLKNQMGLVAMEDRINMHRTDLEKSIAYLGKLVNPNLNIIDGIISMEGNGPHHGNSRRLNIIVAGDDMVELDSVFCFLVGIDFKKVKHISVAKEISVGKYPDLSFLSSRGKDQIINFKLALKSEKFGNIYAWPTTACSRCITAINECGKLLKKHPIRHRKLLTKIFLGKKKINVIIGKAQGLQFPKNEKIICIGRCTKEFADKNEKEYLNKCPPSIKDALEWLKNITN